eukprot:269394-Pleurochrysis_carterae.AAC.1
MSTNAAWTDKAENASVDAMQTANIPITDGSRAFAELHDTFGDSDARRASPSPARQRRGYPDRSTAPRVETNDAAHNASHANPLPPAAIGDKPPTRIAVGETLVVLRRIYPNETCSELGGAGWRVRVLERRGRMALVDFLDARSANGN